MSFNSEKKPHDFSDFLMDEDFVREIRITGTAGNYLKELKGRYPELSEEIDLAVNIFYGIKNISAGNINRGKHETWKRIARRQQVSLSIKVLSIAASFLILLGSAAALYFSFSNNITSRIEKHARSSPDSFESPRLLLSDGNSYYISEVESEIRYSGTGADVLINDSIRISQHVKSEDFNELVIPYGKYSSLILSDGTKVWVNAGSRLVFPPRFNGKTREVFVQGEAYFEVSEDESKPFLVKTSRFNVEVKGTKFSVQADEEDNIFSTLLLEGKVTLATEHRSMLKTGGLDLTPGLIAKVTPNGSGFNVMRVDHPENYIAWKNGYLIFNDELFSDLIARVARYYNIRIEMKSTSMSIRISGKLDLKDDPERVLKGLSIIAKCQIIKEQDKYMFY